MNELFLTAVEQKLFDALSSDLREGWNVELESDSPTETSEHIRMRLYLLQLNDPKLVSFRERIKACETSDALAAQIAKMDLSGVSDEDLAELFFALGPNALSFLIADGLTNAKTDTDLDAIEALMLIRHSLLTAMHA